MLLWHVDPYGAYRNIACEIAVWRYQSQHAASIICEQIKTKCAIVACDEKSIEIHKALTESGAPTHHTHTHTHSHPYLLRLLNKPNKPNDERTRNRKIFEFNITIHIFMCGRAFTKEMEQSIYRNYALQPNPEAAS